MLKRKIMNNSAELNAINHTLQQNNRYAALHNKLLIEELTEIKQVLNKIAKNLKTEKL